MRKYNVILPRPDIDLLHKFVRFKSKDTLNKMVSDILLKNFSSDLCFDNLELDYTGVTFENTYASGNISQGTLATALSGSIQLALVKISIHYTLGYTSLFLNDDYEKCDNESFLRMKLLDKFITEKYNEYNGNDVSFTKRLISNPNDIMMFKPMIMMNTDESVPFQGLIIIFNKNPMLRYIDIRNFRCDDDIDTDREKIMYSMDTSIFCFSELEKGYVPIIINAIYDKVILYQDAVEILSNKYREEYTDKEIRFAHNLSKLNRSGHLGYRRFDIEIEKEDESQEGGSKHDNEELI